jgi:hypothetical protein
VTLDDAIEVLESAGYTVTPPDPDAAWFDAAKAFRDAFRAAADAENDPEFKRRIYYASFDRVKRYSVAGLRAALPLIPKESA